MRCHSLASHSLAGKSEDLREGDRGPHFCLPD